MANTLPANKANISEFLSNAGLYHEVVFEYAEPLRGPIRPLPETLMLPCSSETCVLYPATSHVLQGKDKPRPQEQESLIEASYYCITCRSRGVNFWIKWRAPEDDVPTHQAPGFYVHGTVPRLWMEKCGQYPPRQISPPPGLKKALVGPHKDLYTKAVVSIEHGFGIGALAYIRRLVEDNVGSILTLMREGAVVDNDTTLVQEIDEAFANFSASDRLRIAAKNLPAYLRPGGINPLDQLYSLCSGALHAGEDSEALTDAMASREMFEVVLANLLSHLEQARRTQAAMASLAARLPKK